MISKLEKFLIGRPLKTDQLKDEKFSVLWGLPILSSDAISSVSYAVEAILLVLIGGLGMASYKYMLYAALCIVVLLLILVISYRQTIDCYPSGGGSYIVAKDNLGIIPGLTAGAALSIDYILTAAVSASSGTAAITSTFPVLYKYKVIICIIMIIALTVGNLRGLRDSSKLFGIPTYLFIFSIGIMIVKGIVDVKIFGHVPAHSLYPIPKQTENITIFLFLRAFASGCTALTGVEAVSNGIPNFKEPSQKNAKKVLNLLACVVLFIFGGLSYLTTLYKAVPVSNKTVISQIAMMVFGNSSFMFYVVQATTALILIMAANTAYAGLPLLLSLMAIDGYAPEQFANRGKRLSFSNGIILLGISSIILVVIFNGDTNSLLSLYAIGVFISFTLSQVGMFVRWIKNKGAGWKHKALINGLGSLVTFCTAIIIGCTKFTEGAWFVCIMIPVCVIGMLRIKRHYTRTEEELNLGSTVKLKDVSKLKQKQYVIVPISRVNKPFLKALNYANTISDNVIAFHVSINDDYTKMLRDSWNKYGFKTKLIVKDSPYRDIINVLVSFIDSEEYASGPNDMVTIVVPQLVTKKWWETFLHKQTPFFIKSKLLKKRNIAIVTVPYLVRK